MSRTFNLADLFESVARAVPSRTALVAGERRLTYRELDERATRFACHLSGMRVGRGDRVGILARNRAEWKESELACFKLRAVPVNLDHRCREDDLTHVLRDSGCAALVGEAGLLARVPWFTNTISYGPPYERAVALPRSLPEPQERSGDDHYLIYTAGTTGRPKGVLWRHEDVFFAAMGSFVSEPVASAEQVAENAAAGAGLRMLVCAPLAQAAGQWLGWTCHTTGGTLILWTGRGFDPRAVVRLAEAERAQVVVLTGDAMARPLLAAVKPGELAGLMAVVTGAAAMSGETKAGLLAAVPGLAAVVDALGAAESGLACQAMGAGFGPADGAGAGFGPADGSGAGFGLADGAAVLADGFELAAPGEEGVLGRTGRVARGYWNGADFPCDARGRRWAVPGDLARVEDDGSVTLLGRVANVIRTGGGEVRAEEVEAAVRAHPAVYDAVVVGGPEGRVTAVVAPVAPLSLAELAAHCAGRLDAHAVPGVLRLVSEIHRSPAGQPDYTWARNVAGT
ncbi:AMP-binding protein [Nonomuraea endophytica]|uniref:Fatty-acyl-CoA synthase n=1 Tax=Nonomuraea endophytica TaxID=714136 RepID=A0A7W8ADI9_9ACTN|nr:AMP-binding protein [Nonomuraea endophytica]MBB5082773.1 fatty-acyl-CoA synthase [Nonomuraea endophytica]